MGTDARLCWADQPDRRDWVRVVARAESPVQTHSSGLFCIQEGSLEWQKFIQAPLLPNTSMKKPVTTLDVDSAT